MFQFAMLLLVNAAGGRHVNCRDGPCAPGNDRCIGSSPTYTFHLADPTCDINDPNGPFYDPVHGVYHNFYQIHLALDRNGTGNGPDWGHWVSRDFKKWARMPVAIWNDQWYDNVAIFTGSTTIVDGKPVIMYPGKCQNDPWCGKDGFVYALAVPSNASDPLYTNWSKTGSAFGKNFSNPILSNTGDDPSTAWKTEHGEWRVIGNQACEPEGGNPIYGSMDFVQWYKVGCTSLQAGECPSLFPLPKLTPGSERYLETQGELPNYVHKAGAGPDRLQVGTWTDGRPGPEGLGTVGTWTQLPGSREVSLDIYAGYASKDFWDPVKERRILWLWGRIPSGIQAMPRELTYHAGLKQILYNPVEEIRDLRTHTISRLGSTALQPGQHVILQAAMASEVSLEFAMPSFDTNFSVTLLPSGGSFFLDVVQSANSTPSVKVGFNKNRQPLPLLPDEEKLTMSLFIDGAACEVFFQDGRLAGVVHINATESLEIEASSAAQMVQAVSYGMANIYTSPEEVLATPRLTGMGPPVQETWPGYSKSKMKIAKPKISRGPRQASEATAHDDTGSSQHVCLVVKVRP
ncbi:CWINV4 [Symbiodinium sp. KB8]|nr:CWINV4 [Symbiodinium sp. KB8]